MGLRAEILAAAQRRIDRATEKVMRRLRLVVTRGQIESADDSTDVQNVKVGLLANEERDKVERFQRFGFSSNPTGGSECVVVFVGANRDHGIVIAEDARGVRVTNLGEGESAQYSDGGAEVICRTNGDVEINAGAGNVLVGGASAADFIQKADTFISVFDTALAAAIAAAALILPPNGGDGGTSALGAFQVSWDAAKNTIKATKAKVL